LHNRGGRHFEEHAADSIRVGLTRHFMRR
jgi:hypothetical protein